MVKDDSALTKPIFNDIDVDAEQPETARRGSLTGTGKDVLEIEDALDRLGGVSWFQLVHFTSTGIFWFIQPGVLFAIFANGPCRGGDAVCFGPDQTGTGPCCSQWEGENPGGETNGCDIDIVEDFGTCLFAGDEGAQPYWSTCRSVSCQFDLGSEDNTLFGRELFDSSFFLGWMWSVPVWGGISDKYGRRTALWMALTALHIGQYTSALAPNYWVYLVARHFVGIGVGCTSLTSFIIGTEYAPRSRATPIKAGWSYWSGIGGIVQSFWALLMFNYLPGYNWRMLHLIMSAPLLIWTFFAYCLIEESPRWLLVSKGVPAAMAALVKVAKKNGKMAALSTFELRPPSTSADAVRRGSEAAAVVATAAAEKEAAATGKVAGKDTAKDLCRIQQVRLRVIVVFCLWFSIAFSYYGLILRAVSLPGSVFVNNAIATAVELPA
eukprot:COSAG05_NODE_663_length_8031_cov_8.938225_4_plen_437_part_00